MKIRPLYDRIVVKRIEEKETMQGGLYIPDSAKDKPQRGKVIAAGNGRFTDDGTRLPLEVKTGDTILFGKFAGQEITLDGVQYVIMREDEVLAAFHGSSTTHWDDEGLRAKG